MEELLRGRFAGLVTALDGRYATVVVLGPPLGDSDDARIMSGAGSLLLTVPEGRVPAGALRRHAARARASGARVAGVVLVRAAPAGTGPGTA